MTDSGPVTRTTIEVHPSSQALGDAVMIVDGAFAPLDRFVCAEEGRRIRDRGQLVDGASFPVPVALVLSRQEVSGVSEGDCVVLVDAEGAAVAEVDVDGLWDAGHDRLVLQPHLWWCASGGVVAPSRAGLVSAAPV